ncbi:MAG: rhamnan synthesis F family protein [Lachnospiraceae bacterium]
MKRLAIVSCELEEGKLFSYQKFLLQEVKKIAQSVILVSHQQLTAQERDLCMQAGICIRYSQYIYDVSMWREVILQQRHEINSFNSLIVLNDSFFGPLYPFEEVFDEMDKREVDFWGITVHGRIPKDEKEGADEKDWPRFLQRYFLVFNWTLIRGEKFWEFWERLPEVNEFSQTEAEFEYILTNVFEKCGYKWDVYCDTAEWEKQESAKFVSFLLFQPYKLLREKKLPIISRELFFVPKEVELCYHCGNEIERVLMYIKEYTKYDLNLVYDYLLSKLNVYDIWEKLNSTYILPLGIDSHREISQKVVVVAHLYYEDLFHKSIRYLMNIPVYIDIIITTDSDKKMEILKHECEDTLKNHWIVLKVSSRGREWSSLLIEISEKLERYDIFCFIHDKKSSQMYYSSVGENFNDLLWDNMLASKEYINNTLWLFEENERLGILVPPIVYHGEFWGHAVDFWTICFESTKALAERLQLKCVLNAKKPVLTIGSTFWARVTALKTLLEYPFCLEDFPEEPMEIDGTINHALERILAFVAQDAGYYTGIVMNNCWAESDLVNIKVLLQKILVELREKGNIDITSTFSTFEELRKSDKKDNGDGINEVNSMRRPLWDRIIMKCKNLLK